MPISPFRPANQAPRQSGRLSLNLIEGGGHDRRHRARALFLLFFSVPYKDHGYVETDIM
jgi:hypothetical protein